MNESQSAAQRLHNFVSNDADLTDAEIVEHLKADGVDVRQFLTRLGKASGRATKQPSASERLSALANRAKSRVKQLLAADSADTHIPVDALVYGRNGKSRTRNKKKSSPTNRKK